EEAAVRLRYAGRCPEAPAGVPRGGAEVETLHGIVQERARHDAAVHVDAAGEERRPEPLPRLHAESPRPVGDGRLAAGVGQHPGITRDDVGDLVVRELPQRVARAGELPFAIRPAGVLPVRVHVQPHFVAGPGDLLEVLPDAIRLRAQAGMRRGERLHAHEHAGVDVERDAVAMPPGALEQRGAGLEQALVDRAAAMEEELVILAQDQDRVPGDHGAPAPGPPRGAGRRVPVTAEKRRVASCRGRGIVRRSAGPSPGAAILAAPAPGAYRAAGGRDGVRRPECDGLHGPERRDEGRIDSPVDSRADVTGKLSTEYTVRKADPVADRHRILELWSRITSGAAPDADKLDRFYLEIGRASCRERG